MSFECGQKVFSYTKDKLPPWLQNVGSDGKKVNWVFDGEGARFESGGLSSSEEIGRIIIGTIAVILLLSFAIFYALLRRNERDFRQAKTNASMPK